MSWLAETVRVIGICALLAAGGGCVRSGFLSWLVDVETDAARPDAARDAGGPQVGDVDDDGCVGCTDLGIFYSEFGGTGPGLVCDFDGDGGVSVADFAVLLEHWADGCSQQPTWSLALHLTRFDTHRGQTLHGVLFGPDGLQVTTFSQVIAAASGDVAVAQGLDLMQPYQLHLYLDLDSDARCGSPDLAWLEDPDPRGCAVVLAVAPPAATSTAACVGFAITGDVDGDGCVSDADRQFVDAEILEAVPDLAADVNGDGLVDASDVTALNANMGIGCRRLDAGAGDGAVVDAAARDAVAGDGGDR